MWKEAILHVYSALALHKGNPASLNPLPFPTSLLNLSFCTFIYLIYSGISQLDLLPLLSLIIHSVPAVKNAYFANHPHYLLLTFQLVEHVSLFHLSLQCL